MLYSSKNKLGDKYNVVPIRYILYYYYAHTHRRNMYDKFLWFDISVVHFG